MKTDFPNNFSAEYIICAAIYYRNLPTQSFLPLNLEKGLVICGYRHRQCVEIKNILSKTNDNHSDADLKNETEEGFLTSTNRFVNREEAAQVAFKAGQIDTVIEILYSQDIY